MPLGIYLSVPFCRSKCSYCNFASDVFSRQHFDGYVERLSEDIDHANSLAQANGLLLESQVDSVYLGGGTPTLLLGAQLQRLFVALKDNFRISPGAEITVECAPGTLTPGVIEALGHCAVNRVSLGVQSFVDPESRAVGRLHTASIVADDVSRLRSAGISNISIDLIAGLPHQTLESWNVSLDQAIKLEAEHVSIYMLEVDEDSRLGRELLAGGTRYHAGSVPDEDLIVELYDCASDRLNSTGIHQYEISNFARKGFESRHNLKYWTRQPYMGFGVDAHSMLNCAGSEGTEAVRFSRPETLDSYLNSSSPTLVRVNKTAALEEELFLGLRLNRGVELSPLSAKYGSEASSDFQAAVVDLTSEGLLERQDDVIRLSRRGRLLSNEVFERLLNRQPVLA